MDETIPIAFFIFMFWVIIGVARIISDNRVRSKALDTNATPETIAALMAPARDQTLYASLKWGIILTLLAISFIAVGQFRLDDYSEPLAFGVVLLGAGLGQLLYYAIAKRNLNRP